MLELHFFDMNWNGILKAFVVLLVLSTFATAQQRPLLTEDPRLIAEGKLVTEVGFGYQNQARFPVSGLTGDLYSFLDSGLHFGLGKRAEFQMTGVIQNYLRLENGAGSRNDWGDLLLSTKIKIAGESGSRPDISFRPTVELPNSSQTKGIGTDSMNFFGNLLLGKKAGPAYIFGNIGLAIMTDPTRPAAQNDFITYGIAATVRAGSNVNILGEWNGRHESESFPTPGGESRGQVRFGAQVKSKGIQWDAAITAGTTDFDHKVGFVAGISKEFQLFH